MCTVSFIARKHGYLLAMNRDEKLSRIKGLRPRTVPVDGRMVTCPSEPGGGTWVALNDSNVTFALINWYSVKAGVKSNPVSRGTVVKSVAGRISPVEVSAALARLALKQINPFRLVGIFGAHREICEWRWDLETLVCKNQLWTSQQWISSGHDEPKAQLARSLTFRAALCEKRAGSPGWLRQLHSSHAPSRGPFSICMHRAGAETVSYTEVIVSGSRAIMNYHEAAPCQADC